MARETTTTAAAKRKTSSPSSLLAGTTATKKTIKVDFLLPQKTKDGRPVDLRQIRAVIENMAVQEGGATTIKAPVEGLWARGGEGLEKEELVSFFTVIDITGREGSIGKRLKAIKGELERRFDQDEIFILVSRVQMI
ncbi:hypothetical protein [Nitrososphaera sp.]|uniref:hypothetical protein n=1 Tax=Nitrososphaera sp. TaxID=1971748 RepID=UPI00307E1B37